MRIEVGGERAVKSEEWKVKSEQRSVNRGQWSLIIDHWYWHGVSMFTCVVGAICKSPYAVACVFSSNRSHCKFAHVGGLIAISPYTCVFWAFANIHVNTQKTSWAWYGFVCVCRRGELQFAYIAIRLCCKFTLVANSPTFQIHPCRRANCN